MDKDTRELLAWYVNGTLVGPERDRVEAALQREPGASSVLGWEQVVQAAVKNDSTFEIAPERGLHQTMQRIRADAKPRVAAKSTSASGPFGWLTSRFQWTPGLALACGVVAIQFAVIAQLWSVHSEETEFAAVRATAAKAAASAAYIRVAFKPESTEGELNTMLRAVRAEIVSGPSQLGDYYLLLGKQGAQDALYALQNNPHVESAEIVSGLPVRP